jgi:uncharacterized membrane protein
MGLWILLPLSAAIIMALVNVVDKFFVLEGDDNLNYKSFCLFSGGMQIFICIFMYLFDPLAFNLSSLNIEFFYLFISGILFGISLVLLVKAMDLEEISRVEPLYLVHTVIVPMFGLVILSEILTFIEYVGIILIFISSLLATLRWDGKISAINRTAIFSLLLAGLFFGIANIFLKYVISDGEFSITQTLSIRALGLFSAAGLPMINKNNISDLNKFFKHKSRGITLFIFETLCPILSMYMVILALTKMDVSVVNSFNGVRPIMAVILSVSLSVILKRKAIESSDFQNIFIKILSGVFAAVGIIILA